MRTDHAGERVVDIRPRRAGRPARWAVGGGAEPPGRPEGPAVLLEGYLDPFADVQPQRPR
jgi:hypothetical protein